MSAPTTAGTDEIATLELPTRVVLISGRPVTLELRTRVDAVLGKPFELERLTAAVDDNRVR